MSAAEELPQGPAVQPVKKTFLERYPEWRGWTFGLQITVTTIGVLLAFQADRCAERSSTSAVVTQKFQLAYFEAFRNGKLGGEMISALDATPEGQITVHVKDIQLAAIRDVLSDPNCAQKLTLRARQVFSLYVESAELVRGMVAEIRRYVEMHHTHGRDGNPNEGIQVKHLQGRLREFLVSFTAASMATFLLIDRTLELDPDERAKMEEAQKGAEEDIKTATEGVQRLYPPKLSPVP